LSVVKKSKGQFDIVRYDLVDRKRPLFDQVLDLRQDHEPYDYLSLAKGVRVERRSPKDRHAIVSLLPTFFALGFARESRLTFDPMVVKIWYKDMGSNLYFSQAAPDKPVKGESKLISFVRKIMDSSEK
jgi:hypothetical protein